MKVSSPCNYWRTISLFSSPHLIDGWMNADEWVDGWVDEWMIYLSTSDSGKP
jgi:hypothetical protein